MYKMPTPSQINFNQMQTNQIKLTVKCKNSFSVIENIKKIPKVPSSAVPHSAYYCSKLARCQIPLREGTEGTGKEGHFRIVQECRALRGGLIWFAVLLCTVPKHSSVTYSVHSVHSSVTYRPISR